MAKYLVTVGRSEWADVEVDAGSVREAKEIVAQKLKQATCIADVIEEWDADDEICIGDVRMA